jgi:hypothetical protein
MSEMKKRYMSVLPFLQEVSLQMTNSGCTLHIRAPAFVLPGLARDCIACRLHFAFETRPLKAIFFILWYYIQEAFTFL